jgi:esterase/lipase
MAILGLRHRPSGLNAHFTGADGTFSDYVQQMKAMLREAHAGKNEEESLVAGNAPFELFPPESFRRPGARPYRRGIVLTHGLSDSPYHMRHLAAFFQRNGFRVMTVLLPGHGTQPGDLLHVRWREWLRAAAYAADCMAAEVEELYLGGFSAGGALSLLQAAHDDRVRGLFLFSPALEITSRARWAGLHHLYSWLRPEAAWVSVLLDRDPYKYESFCKNAAAQMHALTRSLPSVAPDIPVFAAASAEDVTVHASATWRFIQQARHPHKHLVWYATAKAEAPQVEWLDSALPAQRILSSAHTAVVMSPQDPHYGAAGEYVNCLHYQAADGSRYRACLAVQDAWLGELTPANLAHGLLRRLMYNPHYAQLEASLQTFIEGLP